MTFKLNKVLITESVDPKCAEILTKKGIHVTTKTGMSKEELLQEIKSYDGLVVRSATKVTAEVIDAAINMKVIGRAGTGVDNVDCEAASHRGILVINAPGGNSISAAELTCGMIFSLSRHIPQAVASLKEGRWDRKKYMGSEVQGKTLVIIGLGRIGKEVANTMQAAGMRTIGYDPLVPPEESIKFGVESFPLDDLFPQADYITVHVPLIKQTKDLINSSVLSRCKKGVKIINCARGGIVNEDDLLEALKSGQCFGAALDVYMEEPPKNRALVEHPNVIATPHLGASTVEAQSRVAVEIADQFVDLIEGRNVPGVVNSPIFCTMLAPENKGLVVLAEQLGKLAQVLKPSSKTYDVSFTTDYDKQSKVIHLAFLVGLLSKESSNLNAINAQNLAEKKGIKVEMKSHSVEGSGDAGSTPQSLQVLTSGLAISGCLRGDLPFLTAINGATFSPPFELTPDKHIFFIDEPASLEKYKISLLTEVQFTSLRIAHHPTSPVMVVTLPSLEQLPTLPQPLPEIHAVLE